MTGSLRLLIVDDEDLFVELVRELLASETGIEIVGRASNGEEAVRLTDSLSPDVVVMDVEMPLMDGIEATRRIHDRHPEVRVVIFTGSDAERDELRAREAGAVAYVRKAHVSALLVEAIRRVTR